MVETEFAAASSALLCGPLLTQHPADSPERFAVIPNIHELLSVGIVRVALREKSLLRSSQTPGHTGNRGRLMLRQGRELKTNPKTTNVRGNQRRTQRARRVHRSAENRPDEHRFQRNHGADHNPGRDPFLAPLETPRMTNIRAALSRSSKINDCIGEPAGCVAPRSALAGNRTRKTALAASAPAHWLVM